MQRLVYSPKVYAFVRTDRYPDGIEISDYIVRGTVQRRVNAVSSATLELRNPNKLWTTPGGAFFRPMDPITIYLTRLADRPIQVFTGYLDTAPYLQLYPGTVSLTASCTLKRLQHTYWDPALPYVMQYLIKQGWTMDQQSGQMWNPSALSPDNRLRPATPDLNDGSIGSLLFNALQDVGGWSEDSIYIEKLPEGIVDKVTAMFKAEAEANQSVASDLSSLFKNLIGDGAAGSGGGALAEAPSLGSDGKYSIADLVHLAQAVGLRGEAAAIAGAIAYAESTGNPNTTNPRLPSVVGLWQIYQEKHPELHKSIEQLKDPLTNAKAMLSVSSHGTKWTPWTTYTGADTGPGGGPGEKTYLKNMPEARKALTSKPESPTQWQERTSRSNKAAAKATGSHPAPEDGVKGSSSKVADNGNRAYPLSVKAKVIATVANHKSRPLGNWQSDDAVDLGAPPGTTWRAVEDGVISSSMGWGDSSGSSHATVYGYRLHLEGDSGTNYFYQHGASNIAPKGKRVKKGDVIGQIGDYRSNGIPAHLHFAAEPPADVEKIVGAGSVSPGSGVDTTALRKKLMDDGALKGRNGTSGFAALDGAGHGFLPIALMAQILSGGKVTVSAGTSGTHAPNSQHYSGEAIDLAIAGVNAPESLKDKIWKTLVSMADPFDQIIYKHTQYQHGIESEYAPSDHFNHIHVAMSGKYKDDPGAIVAKVVQAMGGDTATSGSGSDATGSGSSLDGNSTASAFATYLNFPSVEQTAEAIGLRGQKSLLNDVSFLPFVQQLTEASLRSFQSMPNGNFFAFFPDYFGGFGWRTPYWLIDDVEIIDGKIDLTDDYLATHVFVVGDAVAPGTGIDFSDRLLSGGVMDIESAFKTNFIKRPGDDSKAGLGVTSQMNRDEVLRFLKKYGARPKTEEMPLVRSHYFEAFLAYQRFMQLWSQQFATTFEFTFMPEIYPGGIVGFPDHGLQCYVEEVVHSFDYEAGFTTQAVLSSPASMSTNSADDISAGMVRGFDFVQTTVDHTATPSAEATAKALNNVLNPGQQQLTKNIKNSANTIRNFF